jgi:hypothetical protein
MIVDQIDIKHPAILEPEDDAQVGPHSDGPEAFQVALQRMQVQSRLVHSLDCGRCIKCRKNPANAIDHIRRKLPTVVLFIEPLEALVPKVLDTELL